MCAVIARPARWIVMAADVACIRGKLALSGERAFRGRPGVIIRKSESLSIVGVAVDVDLGRVYFSYNGNWSGNPQRNQALGLAFDNISFSGGLQPAATICSGPTTAASSPPTSSRQSTTACANPKTKPASQTRTNRSSSTAPTTPCC